VIAFPRPPGTLILHGAARRLALPRRELGVRRGPYGSPLAQVGKRDRRLGADRARDRET
jgi:hypothetical protein